MAEVAEHMRMADLKAGWPVVANDGHQIGSVQEVGQHYVLISRSGRLGHLYVPASAIANVERESVYLNVSKAAAELSGWEQAPRGSDAPEHAEDTDLHRHV